MSGAMIVAECPLSWRLKSIQFYCIREVIWHLRSSPGVLEIV